MYGFVDALGRNIYSWYKKKKILNIELGDFISQDREKR